MQRYTGTFGTESAAAVKAAAAVAADNQYRIEVATETPRGALAPVEATTIASTATSTTSATTTASATTKIASATKNDDDDEVDDEQDEATLAREPVNALLSAVLQVRLLSSLFLFVCLFLNCKFFSKTQIFRCSHSHTIRPMSKLPTRHCKRCRRLNKVKRVRSAQR